VETPVATPQSEAEVKRLSFRPLVSVVVLLGAGAIGAAFTLALVRDIVGSEVWVQIAREHFAATIGLPSAALASLFVVLFLEVKSGRIEFELWGMKFRGASGEVVLFIAVFLSIALAIKMLWSTS
jgi:hypothetical protein